MAIAPLSTSSKAAFAISPAYLVLLVIILALAPYKLEAMDDDSVCVIQRLEGTIVFDGVPDDAAWKFIEPFKMITHSPVFGLEPTEKTDIRVTFDQEYVYIGASFYAKDASLIRSATRNRDDSGAESDWLGVLFDTYNDNENGMAFWTNPSGVRTDMAIFNDGVGRMQNPPMNISWNTYWDVETRITDEGWFIEMRIPASSLRFQDVNGNVTMGMTLIRWIPYLNEACVFPAIPNEFGDWSYFRVSMAQKVIFPGLKSRKPVYITPYTIAGFTQFNQLNDAETAYEYGREEDLSAGLDLKYGISSNLTLDLTLNTDFAQVEADDEQVNLTRFNLYYEEKRQFFLERSSLFDFRMGRSNTFFYSRRIGLDDDFNTVPIIGGVRLVGRMGSWDAGILNMQTAESDSLPSENFGVLRMRRKIMNEYSYLGGILTSRIGMNGDFNEVYGLDALLRIRGDDYLKLVWGQSFESGMENNPVSFDNAWYYISLERRRNVGFYYMLNLSGIGQDFNSGMGFTRREDLHSAGGFFNYVWMMKEASPVLRHGPGLRLRHVIRQSNGMLESLGYGLHYQLDMKNLWSFMGVLQYNYENIFEPFEISDDADVPVAEYSYVTFEGTIVSPMTRRAWAMMQFETGEYYDGRYLSLTMEPAWRPTSSFNLSGAYIYNNVDFSSRGQHFIGHIGRVKAVYMFSTKLTLSAYIQYNTALDMMGSNIRFRYNPREGNDLYLVYNERGNTDLQRDNMTIPRLADRTLMLKYTYTLRL